MEFGDLIHDEMARELARARKLFGPTAIVSVEIMTMPTDGNRAVIVVRHCVGMRGHKAASWAELGCGETWDEAFKQASERMPTRRRSR
jgi:hypothetical protein